MTPAQKRDRPLSDSTCYHELGHVFVALFMGVPCDINFVASDRMDAVTVTYWGRLDSPLNRVVASLAGVHAQVLYSPDSLPVELRGSVLTFEFFEKVIRTKQIPAGAEIITDDLSVIYESTTQSAEMLDDQLLFLRSAFDLVLNIFADARRDSIIQELHSDVQAWLAEDDPDIDDATPFLLYQSVRSKGVYDRLNAD